MTDLTKSIVITGPTASGKTALAVKLAEKFNGEIISADSRQVYRHMDLGTGKDLEEYGEVPYHIIDVAEPQEIYHLKRYFEDVAVAIRKIAGKGRLPIFCGGTALYLDAILRRYELKGGEPDFGKREELRHLPASELAEKLREFNSDAYNALSGVERQNHERLLRLLEKSSGNKQESVELPLLKSLVIGVYYPRQDIHRRIEERLDLRLKAGMIEEVKALHEIHGVSWERIEFFGLEYRAIARYLQGEYDWRQMRDSLLVKIRQFAKRQDIWFRKMEREGLNIYWVKHGDYEQSSALIDAFLHDREIGSPQIRLNDIIYGPRTNLLL